MTFSFHAVGFTLPPAYCVDAMSSVCASFRWNQAAQVVPTEDASQFGIEPEESENAARSKVTRAIVRARIADDRRFEIINAFRCFGRAGIIGCCRNRNAVGYTRRLRGLP